MKNKNRLTVVKIGGNIIDNPLILQDFLIDFTKLEGYKLLVHGGGKLASKLAELLGVTSTFKEGRRITDEPMLDIAVMTYAGLINKNITAKLQAMQNNALGLTGADCNLILSKRREVDIVDYGFVGDIIAINTEILIAWLHLDIIPVFSAISHNGKGQLLNTNADTIACSISIALSSFFEVNLVYCFEKKGLLSDIENEDSLILELTPGKYCELKDNNIIHSGMVPKLDNCFMALNNGVGSIRIGGPQVLKSNNTIYTQITQ